MGDHDDGGVAVHDVVDHDVVVHDVVVHGGDVEVHGDVVAHGDGAVVVRDDGDGKVASCVVVHGGVDNDGKVVRKAFSSWVV